MSVYLDNNATTKIHPDVIDEMLPFLKDEYGNPSSTHDFGERASKAVYASRVKVAKLLNSKPSEIVFTASGTEANNIAIRGILKKLPDKKHIVTSSVEHPAVLNVFKYYKKLGYRVDYVPVDHKGSLDLDYLKSSISEETALVSIMYANNETGVFFDIPKVADIVSASSAFFHVDAIQVVGKETIDVKALKCDMLSISAHKFHGPKGVGALYVKSGSITEPFIIGGGQEGRIRAGTENVPGIVGVGKASEIICENLSDNKEYILELRGYFEGSILDKIPSARIIGQESERICNTSSVLFEKIDGDTMLILLNQYKIAASMGSACHAGALEPSYVLRSMGLSEKDSKSTIRFSFSKYTTKDELDYVIKSLVEISEKYSK